MFLRSSAPESISSAFRPSGVSARRRAHIRRSASWATGSHIRPQRAGAHLAHALRAWPSHACFPELGSSSPVCALDARLGQPSGSAPTVCIFCGCVGHVTRRYIVHRSVAWTRLHFHTGRTRHAARAGHTHTHTADTAHGGTRHTRTHTHTYTSSRGHTRERRHVTIGQSLSRHAGHAAHTRKRAAHSRGQRAAHRGPPRARRQRY